MLTWSIEGGAQCHAIGWYCWTKCGSPQTNPGRAADGGERSTFLHSFHLPPTQVQDKDLLVSPQTCSTPECTAGSAAACSLPQCELCRFHTVLPCLNLKPATARQCLTEADLTALSNTANSLISLLRIVFSCFHGQKNKKRSLLHCNVCTNFNMKLGKLSILAYKYDF